MEKLRQYATGKECELIVLMGKTKYRDLGIVSMHSKYDALANLIREAFETDKEVIPAKTKMSEEWRAMGGGVLDEVHITANRKKMIPIIDRVLAEHAKVFANL